MFMGVYFSENMTNGKGKGERGKGRQTGEKGRERKNQEKKI